MTLSGLVFIVFLVLKLCGVIAWSWWWVTAPLWIGAIAWVFVAVPLALWAAGHSRSCGSFGHLGIGRG